jgi:hypothetical protein
MCWNANSSIRDSVKCCICIAVLSGASVSLCEVAHLHRCVKWRMCPSVNCTRVSVKWCICGPCEVVHLRSGASVKWCMCPSVEWCICIAMWSGPSVSLCEVVLLYRCVKWCNRMPLVPCTGWVGSTPTSCSEVSRETRIIIYTEKRNSKKHFILIRGTENAWLRQYLEIGFSLSQYLSLCIYYLYKK